MPSFEQIRDDFAFLDEWDERYKYITIWGAILALIPKNTAMRRTRSRVAPVRSGCM